MQSTNPGLPRTWRATERVVQTVLRSALYELWFFSSSPWALRQVDRQAGAGCSLPARGYLRVTLRSTMICREQLPAHLVLLRIHAIAPFGHPAHQSRRARSRAV